MGCSCGTNKGKSSCDTCSFNNSRILTRLNVFNWIGDIPTSSYINKDSNLYIEVQIKSTVKIICKNVNLIQLKKGDVVVIDEDQPKGYNLGIVTLVGDLVKIQAHKNGIIIDNSILKNIIDIADSKKIEQWKLEVKKEKDILIKCKEALDNHELDIKLSDFEIRADGKKGVLYFSSEDRVDFRDYVKDIQEKIKIKVELRQIASRIEAGMIGGIGSCGRELCCSTWLTKFKTVNLLSATRYQMLSVNTEKLTGQCGKLKCCLNYELDQYIEEYKKLPNLDIILDLEIGEAKYIKADLLRGFLWYILTNKSDKFLKFTFDEVNHIININKMGKKGQIKEVV